MSRFRFQAVALFTGFAALAGCNYQGGGETPVLQINTCTQQTDCGSGADAECRAGMCVARSADVPLTIVLQVTPVSMRDGSEPYPIMLERVLVERPMTDTFELPMPVAITGHVRSDGWPIEATISFTPVGLATDTGAVVPLASGLPVRAVTVTTSIGAPDAVETIDYTAQLLPGTVYRMAVQPSDSLLPPYYDTLTVQEAQEISVDYGPNMDAFTREFRVQSAPAPGEARSLLVRAFDIATSELLSSTETVTATDDTVELRFAQAPPPFRIEVRAETSYDGEQPSATEKWCDSNTPIFPVFSFNADELETNDDVTEIVLPALPERIRFEGIVGLCRAAKDAASADAGQEAAPLPLDSLPITLHARSLLGSDGLPLPAVFDATTTAEFDDATGELRFCAQVMPGIYDVLATPAPSVPCALFAEHFPISAPAGENASGPLLELPAVAHLKGTVQTMDLSPLSHAAVDAVALGRSEGVMLDAEDRSVTRYNRSRQSATEADGQFTLPVDLGSYDVLVKPPTGAGFSWHVHHDVVIGRRDMDFLTVIDMLSPIIVNGTLLTADPNTGLEGAEIAAFAIIDAEFGTERAIPIGRATADERGRFTLLLPPSLNEGW
jgi:hypothetical protein